MNAVVKPFVRSPFNYDRNEASLDSGLRCNDASRAVQSEKDEADINVIVRRFGLTGQVPQNVRVPLETDFTDVFDFQTAQNAIVAARESFMAMHVDVRTRFQNDPARFVEFCLDEKNIDEMRKMGLAVPKPAATAASSSSEPTESASSAAAS